MQHLDAVLVRKKYQLEIKQIEEKLQFQIREREDLKRKIQEVSLENVNLRNTIGELSNRTRDTASTGER